MGKWGWKWGEKGKFWEKIEIMGNKSREKREMGSEMGEKRAIWGKKWEKKGKRDQNGKKWTE